MLYRITLKPIDMPPLERTVTEEALRAALAGALWRNEDAATLVQICMDHLSEGEEVALTVGRPNDLTKKTEIIIRQERAH